MCVCVCVCVCSPHLRYEYLDDSHKHTVFAGMWDAVAPVSVLLSTRCYLPKKCPILSAAEIHVWEMRPCDRSHGQSVDANYSPRLPSLRADSHMIWSFKKISLTHVQHSRLGQKKRYKQEWEQLLQILLFLSKSIWCYNVCVHKNMEVSFSKCHLGAFSEAFWCSFHCDH